MGEKRGQSQPVGLRAASIALLTVALWGGNPVAVQFCLDTMPPIAIAAIRFAMAAAFMLVWCRVSGNPLLVRRDQIGTVLIGGLLLFAQIALFNLGVALTSSSHSTLFINTFIFWVVLIEHFLTKAIRFDAARLFGLLLAAAGAAIALTATTVDTGNRQQLDAPSLLGDVITLLSALILGVKVVYTKSAVKRVEPGTFILWHDIVGVVLFLATSLLFEELVLRVDTAAVWGLLYQGVFVAGLCFVLQAVLLRRHAASQIAVFSFATPLVGISAGVAFRQDAPSLWLFAAGALVALGILLVNWPGREQTDSSRPGAQTS